MNGVSLQNATPTLKSAVNTRESSKTDWDDNVSIGNT